MSGQIIHGLSNEEYHNGEQWRGYVSSTALKHYLRSPKAFRYALDNPTEQTEAQRFGSLFHDLMAAIAESKGDYSMGHDKWVQNVISFMPPVNEKTGMPYGNATKAYKEAYDKFLAENEGMTIAPSQDVMLVMQMAQSLLNDCGSTSEQVRKLLKWGKPEVSIFCETEDGIKIKIRPDLLTSNKIVDWKTTNADDLSEESINRMILNYGYHISAAMYQWVAHEVIGKWLDFYLVIIGKNKPHDAVMVKMNSIMIDDYGVERYGYGYCYDKDTDIVHPGCGALEFKRLLDLHIRCSKEDHWPGAEIFIRDDKYKILEILPPRYYANKFLEE